MDSNIFYETTRYRSSEHKLEDKNMFEQEEKDTEETMSWTHDDKNMFEQEEKNIVQQESNADEKLTSWCEEINSWTDDKTMTWDDFVEMCKKMNKC